MTNRNNFDKHALLLRNPLFSELDSDGLNELVSLTTLIEVANKKVVFNQGDMGGEMFVIAEGRVDVSIVLSNGDKVSLRELSAGEAFGEISLFDHRERTATITTLTSAKFLVIQRDQFVVFLLNQPSATIQLLNTLAKLLRNTNDLMKDNLFANIGSRLAKTLHNMAQAYGRHTRNGLRIDTSFTDNELGRIAGLPPDVIKAHLHDWQSSGLIEVRHGYITILKPEELEQLEGSIPILSA